MVEECTAGDAPVCVDLADAHSEGRGRWLPVDPLAKRRYLQRACALRDADSCMRLAADLRESVSSQVRVDDLKRIVDIYERACGMDTPEACIQASDATAEWADDLGLSPQMQRLRHEKACTVGDDASCRRITMVDALYLKSADYQIDLEADSAQPFHNAIADVSDVLGSCYAEKLDLNHRMEGRLGLRIVLDSTGRVIEQRPMQNSVQDMEIERCVTTTIAGLSFPPSSDDIRVLSVRLDLKRWGSYVRPFETAAYFESRCDAGNTDACSRLARIEPPAIQAQRTTGGTTIRATIDPFEVADVIADQRSEIDRCYKQGLGRNRTLTGAVTLRFAVNREGSVSTAVVEKSTLGDGGVESCLRRLVHSQTFPAPSGGGLVVTNYTFDLDPEQID